MQTVSESVVIKGTRHGLLVCVREDADFHHALEGLRERLVKDSSFLKGAALTFDLGWREVQEEQFVALEGVLQDFQVALNGILSTSLSTRTLAEARGYKAIIGRLGLAEHQGRVIRRRPFAPENRDLETAPRPELAEEPTAAEPTAACAAEDGDRDSEGTLYLRRTLRSGHRVIYPGNVVVVGDVNPGAEIEADGDILVMGSLRGRAHAGCAGNEQAMVAALCLTPMQLRIADKIYVVEKNARRERSGSAGRALVRGGEIRFEPFSSR